MKIFREFYIIIIFYVFIPFYWNVQAQNSDELHIYGYTQVIFLSHYTDYSIFEPEQSLENLSYTFHSNTFSLHQLNLFFQKPISERTTFFLNIEASGSYSSRLPSGYLEIPEGWISYNFSDYLDLKIGLLLPKFNNLTEIQNRLPLFPYLIRPIVYESLIGNILRVEDLRPEKAYLQLTYNYPISDKLNVESALYVGNAESSFLKTPPESSPEEQHHIEHSRIYKGENLNTSLLLGGRIGLENLLKSFKFGISATIDEDNKTTEEASIYGLSSLTIPPLGEITRYRFGMDLGFEFWNKFSMESELMSVFHDHTAIRKNPDFRSVNLNKYFIYSIIKYDINDLTYLYGGYSFTRDFSHDFIRPHSPEATGFNMLTFGAGWTPISNTVVKIQVLTGHLGDTPVMEYTTNFFTVGVSTIF